MQILNLLFIYMSEKISVIVPVYNTEPYLEASLRSLMQQTYRNLEIICVNDGSTDGSLNILKKLQQEDDRIIVIDKPNTGVGDTRNYGLQRATAEWITFMDSDDYLNPDAYEIISKEAFPHNPDLIHFGIKVIHSDTVGNKAKDDAYYTFKYSGLVSDEKKFRTIPDCSLCNKLFRKSIIEKYDIHFEKILYEDLQFVSQYRCVINNVFFIKDKLYNYVRHPGSIMANTFNETPHSIDHIYAFGYIAEFLHKNNLLDKYSKIACNLFQTCYICAIRHATEDMLPEIVLYAQDIRAKYPLFSDRLRMYKKNGTILFKDRLYEHKKGIVTILLESIFSIRKEYINYRLHKVVKVFGISIYKKRRLL